MDGRKRVFALLLHPVLKRRIERVSILILMRLLSLPVVAVVVLLTSTHSFLLIELLLSTLCFSHQVIKAHVLPFKKLVRIHLTIGVERVLSAIFVSKRCPLIALRLPRRLFKTSKSTESTSIILSCSRLLHSSTIQPGTIILLFYVGIT